VIPVVVIDEVGTAVPIAGARGAGGIGIIEVTLRSDAALYAITAIASEPGTFVGAGTVRTAEQVRRAADAGAQFLVSPGATDELLDAMQDCGLPCLAGAASVSDLLRLFERGMTQAKLFPASVVGGPRLIRAVHTVLPELQLCPTGGITADTAAAYLALPNVGCVGGTWLTPSDAVTARDWAHIERLAREAAALRPANES
jgi:2-dehydro-3-deoxyphosphogluconate aldolase/(4S)-4-hydroxy-2-oxoglutarate aldolase